MDIKPPAYEGEISDWDTGMACGFRLHDLFNECNVYSKRNQLSQWRRVLDSVYREISSVLSDKELEMSTSARVEVDAVFNRYLTISTTKNATDAYSFLHRFEMLLRRLGDNHGLLHKKSDSKSSVMLR